MKLLYSSLLTLRQLLFYYKFSDIGCELDVFTCSVSMMTKLFVFVAWMRCFLSVLQSPQFQKAFLSISDILSRSHRCKKSLVPLSDSLFSSNDSLPFVFDNKYSAFWCVIILFPTVCADSDDIIKLLPAVYLNITIIILPETVYSQRILSQCVFQLWSYWSRCVFICRTSGSTQWKQAYYWLSKLFEWLHVVDDLQIHVYWMFRTTCQKGFWRTADFLQGKSWKSIQKFVINNLQRP